MVMRSPIPPAMREELSNDPYMALCALENLQCDGKIEWHHALRYAGKRTNELYTIIPLCKFHHSKAGQKQTDFLVNQQIRARMSHFNAIDDFRAKYPRSNLLPQS